MKTPFDSDVTAESLRKLWQEEEAHRMQEINAIVQKSQQDEQARIEREMKRVWEFQKKSNEANFQSLMQGKIPEGHPLLKHFGAIVNTSLFQRYDRFYRMFDCNS